MLIIIIKYHFKLFNIKIKSFFFFLIFVEVPTLQYNVVLWQLMRIIKRYLPGKYLIITNIVGT